MRIRSSLKILKQRGREKGEGGRGGGGGGERRRRDRQTDRYTDRERKVHASNCYAGRFSSSGKEKPFPLLHKLLKEQFVFFLSERQQERSNEENKEKSSTKKNKKKRAVNFQRMKRSSNF